MTGAEIRRRFLSFFVERGHTLVESSSLVPAGDPTLLFTNSGMVQFKDVFLGLEQRPYRRAVSAQKCVRAGGKHNDLEAVGRTARHHTFFEMLGNWSFGDYFKEEAIAMAWEFVRQELGLSPDRLWVTVHREDPESAAIWRRVAGFGPERIVALGDKDNFWQMAETGPCGPCSEIYVDRGAAFACGPTCGLGRCDCDRWLEIWNLVFMQFDRASDGSLHPLPQRSVDTGMGLERVAAVLQGVDSDYETDLFRPLIAAIERQTGQPYRAGPEGFPMRVLADHARAVTFLLTDGVMPANEGRGYVLRRILRRAVRVGRQLGEGMRLSSLVPVVVATLGDAYPELRRHQQAVERLVAAEEERFTATLDAGNRRLEEALRRAQEEGRAAFPGREAFTLYDTYGFPVELTEEVARERGLELDRQGFEEAMTEQRARARAHRAGGAGVEEALRDLPESRFVGYTDLACAATVRLVYDRGVVDSLTAGEEGEVVLEPTPFYPEGGGQVGDTGRLVGVGLVAEVTDTQKHAGRIYSRVRVVEGRLAPGLEVRAEVDRERREGAMRNHTGTHILHQALRQVLGEQVRQTGSLVAPDRLRFDFASPRPLTAEDLRAVEELANRQILADLPVRTEVVSMAEARRRGALMFFDEKYGESVRLVAVGEFSLELCGGTHCRTSGQIGLLKILGETGIGAGMRRVEAVTGLGSLATWQRLEAERRQLAEALGAPRPEESAARAEELKARLAEAERERDRLRGRERQAVVRRLWQAAGNGGGPRVAVGHLPEADPAELRRAVDDWRQEGGSGVLVLGSVREGRASFVVAVSPDLAERVDAAAVCRRAAAAGGGKGGGRADLAQGGTPDPSGLDRALAEARRAAVERVAVAASSR